MIISHSRKFIFVCPRKVASTSVEIALSRSCSEDDVIIGDDLFCNGVLSSQNQAALPACSRHILPDNLRENIGAKVWDEYFKFTVVRNPWDLVVSYIHFKFGPDWENISRWNWYQYRHFHAVRRRFYQRRARHDFTRGRKRDSTELILRKGAFPYIYDIPAFYVIDAQVRAYADYYIRFENLQRDYDKVCRVLQLPRQSLPKARTDTRSKDDDYRDYYTAWSRDYIAALCHEMIDAFGYRFCRSASGSPSPRMGVG